VEPINNSFINKYAPKVSKSVCRGTRKFLAGMERSDILAPIILLETTVVTGRTYQAHKRGGFIEARERFTEEIMGSIFWLFGFKMFSKIGDEIGKKLLKLKDIHCDVATGNVRKPIENFVKDHANLSKKSFGAFKCTKVLASILLSNAIIGFVVPKLNQGITRQFQKSINNVNQKHTELYNKGLSMEEFINQKVNSEKPKQSKSKKAKPSFGMNMFHVANLFENNATAQLLSNDVGTAGGRAINARNKHERYEILFRDITSIYFYMFCRHNLNTFFNKMESGRGTRLNPFSAKFLHNHMLSNLFKGDNANTGYTAEEFNKKMFGNNKDIPESIADGFENKVMTIKKLEKIAEQNPGSISKEILNRAKRMSYLQPAINGENVISEKELQDSFNGGLINEPEFLHAVYKEHFGTVDSENKSKFSFFKKNQESLSKKYKINDAYSFVSEGSISDLHEQIKDYAKDIAENAVKKGEKITLKTIKNANHTNFALNAFNLGVGFAVSSYFLSTAIPKIQYWITKITTGENAFPGVTKYDNNSAKQKQKTKA
jgi:hypothetical protein